MDGAEKAAEGVRSIPLANGEEVLVDEQDFATYGQRRWQINRGGYAYCNTPKKDGGPGGQALLHRLIADAKPGEIVHHRNGDRLDNRRSNLEVVAGQRVHVLQHREENLRRLRLHNEQRRSVANGHNQATP